MFRPWGSEAFYFEFYNLLLISSWHDEIPQTASSLHCNDEACNGEAVCGITLTCRLHCIMKCFQHDAKCQLNYWVLHAYVVGQGEYLAWVALEKTLKPWTRNYCYKLNQAALDLGRNNRTLNIEHWPSECETTAYTDIDAEGERDWRWELVVSITYIAITNRLADGKVVCLFTG